MKNETTRNKIKAARAMKGLTQAQLAKKLCITQSAMSYWEKNINHVAFGDVQRLCKVLGLDLNDLKGV